MNNKYMILADLFLKVLSKKDNDKIIKKINEIDYKNNIETLLCLTMYRKNDKIFKYLIDKGVNINTDNGSGITIFNSILEQILWDTLNNIRGNFFDNTLWLLIAYGDGDLSIGYKNNFYELISDQEYKITDEKGKKLLQHIKKKIYDLNTEKKYHKLNIAKKKLNFCKHKNYLDSHIIKDILEMSKKIYYENLALKRAL